ncbi:MAG: hypothetical protein ACR2JD_02040 [Nocardioides sp.]
MTATDAPAPAPSRRAERSAPAWRRLVPYLLFLAVSIGVVAFHMDKFPYISPIDEGVHYDYIENLPHVPAGGEKMDQEALDETACRTYGPDYPQGLPPCGTTPYDPNTFPSQGFSTAGTTPPVYYVVTAAVARPLAAVTPWTTWQISRGLGALWLAGLMSVCLLLALRLGAGRVPAIGAALLVGTSTDVVASAATIGPDVATAVCGGLVTLAALAFDGTRRATLWLLAAVAVASLVKFTAFTAVGAAMICLWMVHWGRRREPARPGVGRTVLVSVAMFAVFGLLSFLWGLRYKETTIIDVNTIPMNQIFLADRIRWEDINATLYYTFVTPVTGNWNPLFLDNFANGRLEGIVVGALVLGVLGAAFTCGRNWTVSGLGWGVAILALLGPLLLTLLNFYANGLFFGISPRYGFALLPAFAAATAWTLRAPGPAKALLVVGGLSVVSFFL